MTSEQKKTNPKLLLLLLLFCNILCLLLVKKKTRRNAILLLILKKKLNLITIIFFFWGGRRKRGWRGRDSLKIIIIIIWALTAIIKIIVRPNYFYKWCCDSYLLDFKWFVIGACTPFPPSPPYSSSSLSSPFIYGSR